MATTRGARAQRLGPPFWVLVTGSTLFFTAQGMLFPVLPRYIDRELDGGSLAVGITVSSFALGAMVARPIGGALADRVGRRWVAGVGALFWGAMVGLYPVAGAAGGVPALVGVRVAGGLGGGVLFVATATIATDLSPSDQRVRGFGLFSASTLVGFAIGPAIGETVLDGRRYGLTFSICALLALAPAIAMLVLPDTRPAVVATAPRRTERRALLHPAARRPGIAMLLGSLGFVTFTAFVPLYAEDVGLDRVAIPLTVTAVVNLSARLIGARYADRIDRRLLATVSLACVGSAAATLALWAAPAGILVAAVLNGLGNAYLFSGFLAMTVEAATDAERARAIGSLTMFSDVANSAGGALLGLAASATSYRGAFGLASALAVCSIGVLAHTTRARAPAVASAFGDDHHVDFGDHALDAAP